MSEHPPKEEPSVSDEGSPAENLVGETLSERYRLDDYIGGGGMGEVYRAEHVMMKKTVAVKVLRPDVLHHDNVVERFRREAQAAANIDHPNICSATDFGKTDDGHFYLVMEFLEGETLSARLAREGALETGTVIEIGDEIAAALERAHDLGVVHRDLKPDNVMLVDQPGDGSVLKVLDFGVSRVQMADDTPSITQTGAIFGTPSYMAPEQASAESVDERADLYALGTVLYELVTGQPVFQAEESVKVMAAHLEQPPTPPSQVRGAEVSPAFERLILDMLEKDPDNRPQSATDVRGRLKALDAPDSASTEKETDSNASQTLEVQLPTGKWLETAGESSRRWLERLEAQLPEELGLGPLDRSKVAAFGMLLLACCLLGGVLLLYATSSEFAPSYDEVTDQLNQDRAAYVEQAGIEDAVDQLHSGSARRAHDDLESAAESAGTNAHLEYLRGRAHARMSKWDTALDHYGRAVDQNDDYLVDPILISDVIYALDSRNDEVADKADAILSPHLSRTIVQEAVAETTWTANAKRTRQRAYDLLHERDLVAGLDAWLNASVRLRHGNGCETYKQAVNRLVDLQDPRGLKVLRAMSDVPRRGCGPLNLRDCYKCVRDDIDDAIESLEQYE